MAQVVALLISEKYIKENSEIDENVDMKLLLPTVVYCQREYIKNSIGSPLYDAISAEIIANSGSLVTAEYITLNDTYIAPALLAWVMHEAQVPLLYKFRNKSVATNSAENSNPIDNAVHRYLKDIYKPRAVLYSQDLDRFLCANSADYPLYLTYTTSDQVVAKETKPTVSVFMGTKRNKGCNYD